MKKFKLISMILLSATLLTGCVDFSSNEKKNIIATTYPVEYLVSMMYGYNAEVKSIYPTSVETSTYKLTDKQIKTYAKNDIFVYNGQTDEKNIAANLLNKNSNLQLIDATKGTSIKRDEEELWLCPSNYLMLAQNIRNKLEEYIVSTSNQNSIESNYEAIKLIISKYDAELKFVADNATNKTIIIGNDVFEFLSKYGYNVINLEKNDDYHPSNLNEAKKEIAAGTATYVFILNTDEESDNVKDLVAAGAKTVKIDSMKNLTDEQVANNVDYQQLMDSFIESIKTEVYN